MNELTREQAAQESPVGVDHGCAEPFKRLTHAFYKGFYI